MTPIDQLAMRIYVMGVLSPYLLGTLLGAAIWILAGFGLGTAFKRFLAERYGQALGFLMAAIIFTVLFALLSRDGDTIAWDEARAIYGVPFVCGGLFFALAGVIGQASRDKKPSVAINISGIALIIAVMAGGIWWYEIRTAYAEFDIEAEARKDPRLEGLLALKETQPLVYDDLMRRLEAGETPFSANATARVFREWFEQNRQSILRSSGDTGVNALTDLDLQLLRELKTANPTYCVRTAMGDRPADLRNETSYALEVQASGALAMALRSSDQESSGVASKEEIDRHIAMIFLRYAETDPDSFVLYMESAELLKSQYSAEDCEAAIMFAEEFNRTPPAMRARLARSPLLSDPTYELSAETERSLMDAALTASATITNRSTPIRLDDVTTITGVTYARPNLVYSHALDVSNFDRVRFTTFINANSLPSACANPDLKFNIAQGIGYTYRYFTGDRMVFEYTIDQTSCDLGHIQ